MSLAERLKQMRKRKYSQEELAELLHVHTNTISRWESGAMEPKVKKLAEIAKLLGTTAAYLLGDTDNPMPEDSADFKGVEEKEVDTPRAKVEDRGTLSYTFADGQKLEVPATPEYAAQFWARVDKMMGTQAV